MDVNERIKIASKRNLVQLDLSNLALTTLPESIGQLTQLRKLNLAKNNLTTLPESFGKLKHLQFLNLSSNSIAILPNSFSRLQALETLHLEDNYCSNFPNVILKLRQLKILNLEHNNLLRVPQEIGQLKQLEQLNLSRNNLSQLPNGIGQLKVLKVLNLRANQLSDLPEEIRFLENTRQLLLQGNPLEKDLGDKVGTSITEIGKFYKGRKIEAIIKQAIAENAYRLDLSHQELHEIPASVFQLKSLKILALDHNYIKDVPKDIMKLQSLEVLDLSHNHLIQLPNELKQMKSLKYYETAGNALNGAIQKKPIYRVKEVNIRLKRVRKEHLTTLNLADCGLNHIPNEVFELKHLKTLILGKEYAKKADKRYRNKITSLPPAIGQLTQLQVLDCTNNMISTLPQEINHLQKLNQLIITNNDFEQLPTLSNKIQLVTLEASNNKISQFGKFLDHQSSLHTLNLSNNRLKNIPATIERLKPLRLLDLSSNQLQQLTNTLGQLTNLKELYLHRNQFNVLPASLGDLQQLHTLNIADNQLTDLPSSIHKLAPNLKAINLSNNNFTDLPTEIGTLSELKVLIASNNHFIDFPEAILNLTQLLKLRIQFNQIQHIPLAIQQLTHLDQISIEGNPMPKDAVKMAKKGLLPLVEWLELQQTKAIIKRVKDDKASVLDLSNRKLKEIPSEVFELSHLKQLLLGRAMVTETDIPLQNSISSIPQNIKKLQQLEVLDISNNQLSSVSNTIFQLPKLKVLRVGYNQITKLPESIGQATQLTHLDLRSNQLKNLPLSMAHLQDLQDLKLTFNPLATPYSELFLLDMRTTKYWFSNQKLNQRLRIKSLRNIKEIDLSYCNLTTIPSAVYQMYGLQHIDLSHNQLKTITEDFFTLQQLRSINFDNNQIAELPNHFINLKKLTQVSVTDNPLTKPTIQVVNQGMSVLRNWFQKEIFNGKVEKIIYQKSSTFSSAFETNEGKCCQICFDEKELNGFNSYLGLQFYHQSCFACNGTGHIDNDNENLHLILFEANQQQLKDKAMLATLFQQKKTFEETLLFQNSRQNSMNTILNRYESRLKQLIGRFYFYEEVQRRLHHILYNQYLLQSTLDHFQKVEIVQSGMSLNLSEKTALQTEMVDEVVELEKLIQENTYLMIPTTVTEPINLLIEKYLQLFGVLSEV